MLDQLSQDQINLFPRFRDKWIKSLTNSINDEKAKEFIDYIYGLSGFNKPLYIKTSSPLAAQYTANLFRRAQVGAQVRDQVRDQVWDQVWAQVRDQVGAQVWDQVGAQVGAQVRDQVGDQVWAQVRDQVGAQELKYFHFASHGSILDYNWVSFFEYFQEIGINVTGKFKKFKTLLFESNIYDMIQLKGVCIYCEKPVQIKRSEEGRLHSTATGEPAIKWSDGFELYFINGRAMPKFIFRKSFTKEDFLTEQNEDTKAGMYEIIESNGEGSMLQFLGATVVDESTIVHKNGDIENLTLYKTSERFTGETDLNGNNNCQLAWLKMICPSTGSKYLIPSDSSFNNAISAAKYHRPEDVPSELAYSWHSRN